MSIAVVWLKRDLRLTDHQPLLNAVSTGLPVLLVYCFEPILMSDPHYRPRHWQFVAESLRDMQSKLPQGALFCSMQSAQHTLSQLHENFGIKYIFSHQEVGLENTFARDRMIAQYCNSAMIGWHQAPLGAVVRGLTNRLNWDKHWQQMMRAEQANVSLEQVNWFTEHQLICDLKAIFKQLPTEQGEFQQGGESLAQTTLRSFFQSRGQAYAYSLSSPLSSQIHCSRLSVYLAWGNLSLRQVYQTVLEHWQLKGWRRSLVAFSSRLHWHCHFIQKFETEYHIQFHNLNRGYDNLPRVGGELAEQRLLAWQQGKTGVPMVDACMRCLISTGYINFRMRAMLVSFLCHHLELDWRAGVSYLASLFLDFEPGIHYSQFQMQAGVTGFNTIRIYSPVKQGEEKDPDGTFVKKWLPMLAEIPAPLIHAPWQLSDMEKLMYNFDSQTYPDPIVDVNQQYKSAKDLLWQWQKRPEVQKHVPRLLMRNVRPAK